MNRDPITDAQRVNAAFQAVLEGRFDAQEVHDVLQGRAGTIQDYWRLRAERGIAEQIARACGAADNEIRRAVMQANQEVEDLLSRSSE